MAHCSHPAGLLCSYKKFHLLMPIPLLFDVLYWSHKHYTAMGKSARLIWLSPHIWWAKSIFFSEKNTPSVFKTKTYGRARDVQLKMDTQVKNVTVRGQALAERLKICTPCRMFWVQLPEIPVSDVKEFSLRPWRASTNQKRHSIAHDTFRGWLSLFTFPRKEHQTTP